MATVVDRYQHEREPQKQIHTEPKVRARPSLLTTREKFLIVFMAVVVALFAISIINTEAKIFTVNSENVALESKIDEQTKVNNDLKDEISLLSMPETIIQKAEQMGLTLNDQNVKAVK